MHAGALDYPDRPACADARRDIKRHPISNRRIIISRTHELKAAGYSTALIGKAHFEPHAAKSFFENLAAGEDSFGPHRGFDHKEEYGEKIANEFAVFEKLFHYPKPIFIPPTSVSFMTSRRRYERSTRKRSKPFVRMKLKSQVAMDTEMPKYSKVITKDAEALEAIAAKYEHDVAAQTLRKIELAELELVIFGGVGTLLAIILSVGLACGIAKPKHANGWIGAI